MAPVLASLLLLGLLAAQRDSRRASAHEQRTAGFFTRGPVPFSDFYEDGVGSVSIEATDQVDDDAATFGDRARVRAHFSARGDRYDVQLDVAGFPPARSSFSSAAVSSRSLQSGEALRTRLDFPNAPRYPIGGGVLLDRDIYGSTGIGFVRTTKVHAAIAIWGFGTVSKNGQVATSNALIHVAALSRAAHADDGTHRLLPEARDEDAEIEVLAENLPRDIEPTGFIQFWFDDVEILLDGLPIPTRAYVEAVPLRNPEEARPASTEEVSGPITYYGVVPPVAFPGTVAAASPPPSGPIFAPATPTGFFPEPLVRTEPPLNSQPLQIPFARDLSGFPSTPQPLNAQPAVPLLPSIPPLNAQPLPLQRVRAR